jgi:hypothetical protein
MCFRRCRNGGCQRAIARRDEAIVRVLAKQFSLPLETWITMHEDLRNSPRCKVTFEALCRVCSAMSAGRSERRLISTDFCRAHGQANVSLRADRPPDSQMSGLAFGSCLTGRQRELVEIWSVAGTTSSTQIGNRPERAHEAGSRDLIVHRRALIAARLARLSP